MVRQNLTVCEIPDPCISSNSHQKLSLLELFEVFDDKKELRLNHDLYIAVLCTYTWSVLQFAFVRTATAETVADHDPLHETKKEVKNMRGRSVSIYFFIFN
jgi:hypothetical protein